MHAMQRGNQACRRSCFFDAHRACLAKRCRKWFYQEPVACISWSRDLLGKVVVVGTTQKLRCVENRRDYGLCCRFVRHIAVVVLSQLRVELQSFAIIGISVCMVAECSLSFAPKPVGDRIVGINLNGEVDPNCWTEM